MSEAEAEEAVDIAEAEAEAAEATAEAAAEAAAAEAAAATAAAEAAAAAAAAAAEEEAEEEGEAAEEAEEEEETVRRPIYRSAAVHAPLAAAQLWPEAGVVSAGAVSGSGEGLQPPTSQDGWWVASGEAGRVLNTEWVWAPESPQPPVDPTALSGAEAEVESLRVQLSQVQATNSALRAELTAARVAGIRATNARTPPGKPGSPGWHGCSEARPGPLCRRSASTRWRGRGSRRSRRGFRDS